MNLIWLISLTIKSNKNKNYTFLLSNPDLFAELPDFLYKLLSLMKTPPNRFQIRLGFFHADPLNRKHPVSLHFRFCMVICSQSWLPCPRCIQHFRLFGWLYLRNWGNHKLLIVLIQRRWLLQVYLASGLELQQIDDVLLIRNSILNTFIDRLDLWNVISFQLASIILSCVF